MVNRSENVHQHPVEGSLIELRLLGAVLFVDHLTDELQNFCHKLVLIEAEHREEHDNELYKTINISEVKSVIWSFLWSLSSAFISIEDCFFNTCANHDFAEAINPHSSETGEQSIYLSFLIFFVVYIGHNYPFDEEFFQIRMI